MAIQIRTEPICTREKLHDPIHGNDQEKHGEHLKHPFLIGLSQHSCQHEWEQEPPVGAQRHQQIRAVTCQPARQYRNRHVHQNDLQHPVPKIGQLPSPDQLPQADEVEHVDRDLGGGDTEGAADDEGVEKKSVPVLGPTERIPGNHRRVLRD